MQPIILAGGFGKRLFPISTAKLPKQFIKFESSRFSFFQKTLLRLKRYQKPIVIGNILHKELIALQMKEINVMGLVILEVSSNGTFIASLLGAIFAKNLGNQILGVFPTDHYIDNLNSFNFDIEKAVNLSKEGQIICFGQKANIVDEKYGHIIAVKMYSNIFLGKKFIEKPLKDQICTKNCYWNLGIFIFHSNFLEKFYLSDWNKVSNLINKVDYLDNNIVIDLKSFDISKKNSFDVEIMNNLNSFYMICATFPWIDIGSIEKLNIYYKKLKYNSK